MNKVVRKALERVNQVRIEMGKQPLEEMPPGVIGCPARCPISTALDHEFHAGGFGLHETSAKERTGIEPVARAWGMDIMTPTLGVRKVEYPDEVQQFIDEFDGGEIPDLVIDEDSF